MIDSLLTWIRTRAKAEFVVEETANARSSGEQKPANQRHDESMSPAPVN